jgi:hypothetical protein
MERITSRSAALCASLAFGGCSLEPRSTPTAAIDASIEAAAPEAGSPSGSGGAGGQGGIGSTDGPAGGSSGGSRGGASDASGVDDASNEAGSDATTDTADARSACTGLFCEDFELGQIDSAKWNVQMAGGSTVAIEEQVVAHGRHAAHFHSLGTPAGGATQAYVYLLTKNVPSVLRLHNFGRAYFYMTPKPRSINIGLLFGGTSGFPKPTYMSIASHSGGWQLGFIKLQGSPSGEVQAYPVDVMPVSTWMCLEWEFDDQPDVIGFWRDGQVIGTLDPSHIDYPPGHTPGAPLYNGTSTGLVGGFTDFGFGFYDWHPGSFAFDVYYDDIVLDTKRVGCL